MGWNQNRVKNMVVVVMALMVIVDYVKCEDGENNIHDSAHTSSFQHGGFVRRSGTHFILNNKRFYFNGFNAYWLMYMASNPSTRSKVTTIFQQASTHGLTVARTWAFSDGGAYGALQVSPGSYDEKMFRGLDFVVSEAGKHGVRLILSLVNNWKDFGGKNQYVEWAKEHAHDVNNEDDFFSHPVVKKYYQNHIKVVLTRKNTITGVAYKDDPAIFAWELMNEPRSQQPNSAIFFQEWVKEMGAYVKSIDSIHMLEIGLEGFYGETMPQKKQINPGYQLIGTDFISNNLVSHVDFATLHLYPEQWLPGSNEATQGAFVDKWVEAHIEDAKRVLGKPVIIGEFGKSSKFSGFSMEQRDSYIRKLYNVIYKSASSGGPCAGGLFWQLMAQGMDSFRDGYEIIFEESPSTTTIIDQQSHKMSILA